MIISKTPVRISFIGGGTDFPEFFAQQRMGSIIISTAINKFIYVIIKKRFDKKITLNYRSIALSVNSIHEISHDFIRETILFATSGKDLNGIDINIISDVPVEGSGLGSSSSLIVGLLNAVYTYLGKRIDYEELAKDACEIEIERLNRPIGYQDQYVAVYGGFRAYSFMDDHGDTEVFIDNLKTDFDNNNRIFKNLESNLFLYFINYERNSTQILTEQKNNIKDKKRELNKIYAMSKLLLDVFKKEKMFDTKIFGELLEDSWILKKEFANNITNPEIEQMIYTAKISGAIGCKVLGAGGGGFLLVYCEPEYHETLISAMSNYIELNFEFEEKGTHIIYNG